LLYNQESYNRSKKRLIPGSDEWFVMFLSSRWGKPSYEIESLPISEFNKQKAFWEHCSWGGIDDIMALHHSFYVSVKTNNKSKLSVVRVKEIATYTSAVKAFFIESTKTIRNAFMGIAKAMKDKNNG